MRGRWPLFEERALEFDPLDFELRRVQIFDHRSRIPCIENATILISKRTRVGQWEILKPSAKLIGPKFIVIDDDRFAYALDFDTVQVGATQSNGKLWRSRTFFTRFSLNTGCSHSDQHLAPAEWMVQPESVTEIGLFQRCFAE